MEQDVPPQLSPASGYVCTEDTRNMTERIGWLFVPLTKHMECLFPLLPVLLSLLQAWSLNSKCLVSQKCQLTHLWWTYLTPVCTCGAGHSLCQSRGSLQAHNSIGLIGCNWESGAPSSFAGLLTESRPTTFLLGLISSKGMKKLCTVPSAPGFIERCDFNPPKLSWRCCHSLWSCFSEWESPRAVKSSSTPHVLANNTEIPCWGIPFWYSRYHSQAAFLGE